MNPRELLLHSAVDPGDGLLIHVDTTSAAWEYIGLTVHRLELGAPLFIESDGDEYAIVLLSGACTIVQAGERVNLGPRANVFDDPPWAYYLSVGTDCSVEVESTTEIAVCRSKAADSKPAKLISPSDVEIEIRGAGNASREIRHVIKPEFPADTLLVVEVITPSGNWSSYPPHKHDIHDMPREADLEEIYYYRIDSPDGFGLQRLYTADGTIDEAFVIRDGDLLLVPFGYHAFAMAQGYTGYYLNVLAGDEPVRTMQPSDDPKHAWVRATWNDGMNAGIASWNDIETRINGEAGKRQR
ncbi:MAG TPA: 5-deoxy-glucuronate isomerase [Thermomicrobiales bacterium]|nr:5-deoxy-glucuronate isomerase [Thermomicrobiales bacterium]